MSHVSETADPAPKFAPFFGKSWVVLSVVVGLILLGMFCFGPLFMQTGSVIWTLIRWVFSPII